MAVGCISSISRWGGLGGVRAYQEIAIDQEELGWLDTELIWPFTRVQAIPWADHVVTYVGEQEVEEGGYHGTAALT